MTAEYLRKRVDALRWYHSIDVGHGVVTKGTDNTPERLRRLQLPETLRGKSVLDVGAWDGFFSFEAERRGASRVVATDYYAWHGLGWGTENGKAGFELARELLNSHVEDVAVDVLDLNSDRVGGKFNVVFFLGVLYHMQHPLLALERIASVCDGMLILETVVDMIGFRRPAVAFYPDRELAGDPTNWWGPNESAVHGMLHAVGFDTVKTITAPRSAAFRAARAVSHHLRGKNTLSRAYRQDRAVFHAYKESLRSGLGVSR